MKIMKKIIGVLLIVALFLPECSVVQQGEVVNAKQQSDYTLAAKNDSAVNMNQKKKLVKKTKNANIYTLGNGANSAEFYSSDVRYKDENGTLLDYDNSLEENGELLSDNGTEVDEYKYKTCQNDKMSYFPEKADEDTPILCEYGKYDAQIAPIMNTKKVSANEEIVEDIYEKKEDKIVSVDYKEAKHDVKYRYESTNEGLKESIILENGLVNTFSFSIMLSHCGIVTQEQLKNDIKKFSKSIHTKSGEDLFLYDIQKQKIVGLLPAAFMNDNKGKYNNDCTYDVNIVSQNSEKVQYELVLTISKQFLEDPKCEYPVTVDPSFVWDSSNKERFSSAYVCSTKPNATYTDGKTNILCVGKRDTANDICRSYMSFGGINSILEDKYLDSATLDLNYVDSDSGMNMYVRQVTSSWSSTNITYNNQPKKLKQELAQFTTSGRAGSVSISLNPETLDDKVRDEQSIYGFEITDSKADNNSKSTKSAWIYNGVSVNGTKIPKLTVIYYDKSSYTATPHLTYKTYKETGAWSEEVQDGAEAGSPSLSGRARAFSMNVNANGYTIGSVKYRAYYDETGWTGWKSNGGVAGNTSQSYKMKAIEVKAYGSDGNESACYDVYYRTYVPGRGWLGWAKNGEEAGDYTANNCITAMEAILVPKVYYGMNFVKSSGKVTSIDNQRQSSFYMSNGNKNKVYSLGINLCDAVARRNHFISVKTILNNGNVVSGVSGSGQSTVKIGGTTNNPISGYSMRFNDISMRSRYNIEHVGNTSSDNVEGKWLVNNRVSGKTTGGYTMENMSLRVVPKGYDEGKRACYSSNFVVEEDGYQFANWPLSFGYSSNYVIPRERYVNLGGEVFANEFYNAKAKWRGSCYGMSLSSLMFFKKKWNVNNIASNIDEDAQSAFRLQQPVYTKSSKLTELIEYCQLSWNLGNLGNTFSTYYKQYKKMVTAINSNKGNYIFIMYADDGGHAVVPINAKKVSNDIYTIELYDVNIPGKVSTATMNITDNTFSYVYGDTHYTSTNMVSVDELINLHGETFNNIINNASGSVSTMNGVLSKDACMIVLKGENANEVVIKDKNGNDVSENKEVSIVPSIDKPGEVVYHVPKGEYSINTKEDTEVSVLNLDTSIHYSSSEKGSIHIGFNDDYTIDSSFEGHNGDKQDVEITTYDKHKNKKNFRYFSNKVKVTGKDRNNIVKSIK